MITAARPAWIFAFTGLQPAQFRKLVRLIAERFLVPRFSAGASISCRLNGRQSLEPHSTDEYRHLMATSSGDNYTEHGSPSMPLDPQDAAAELRRLDDRSQLGTRWQVYELLTAAVVLGGTTFVYHASRQDLGMWIWVAAPAALMVAAVLGWRRRAVGRREAQWARAATVAAVLLTPLSMTVLSPLVTRNAGWGAALAAIPALPPLVAAARLTFR